MWFASKIGEPGDSKSKTKSTEKFFIHVADSYPDVKTQLKTVASDDEIKEALIRQVNVATTDGEPNKLFLVRAEVTDGVPTVGMTMKYKWSSIVLSAVHEQAAIRRAAQYFQSIHELRNASAVEIIGMHKINKTNAKLLLFLD